MNARFELCVQFIFDREGRVLENNPADPGGLTKFGVSRKSYPNLDIANLTEQQAKEIYYRDYWTPLACDDFEDPRLALAVFDTGVNQGVGTAKAILGEFVGEAATPERYLFKRLRRYVNLIIAKPNLKVWTLDWLLRVVKVAEFTFPPDVR